MNRQRSRDRKLLIDLLEDRAVPSAATASASAAGSQTLASQLNQFGTQVDTAYASFATAVRQAETTLVSRSDSSGNPVAATGTSATVLATVTQQLSTMSQAITLAASSASLGLSSPISGLLQAQLTGASPGSLMSRMTGLFASASAGSTTGSVPEASLPLLFTAVNNAIAASYNSTSLEGYYAAIGQASGGRGTNTGTDTAFDLNSIGSQENAAFSSFATAVRQAETTLVGGTVAATGTSTTVLATVTQQINLLSNDIVSVLGATSAASDTGALQGAFSGGPGSLLSRMSNLLAAAAAGSTTGSVPQASLPLLFAAVNGAIAASYDETVVSTFLLATNPNLIPAANNSSGSSNPNSNLAGIPNTTSGAGSLNVALNRGSISTTTGTSVTGSTTYPVTSVGGGSSTTGVGGITGTGTGTTGSVNSGVGGIATTGTGSVGNTGTVGTIGTTNTGTSGVSTTTTSGPGVTSGSETGTIGGNTLNPPGTAGSGSTSTTGTGIIGPIGNTGTIGTGSSSGTTIGSGAGSSGVSPTV